MKVSPIVRLALVSAFVVMGLSSCAGGDASPPPPATAAVAATTPDGGSTPLPRSSPVQVSATPTQSTAPVTPRPRLPQTPSDPAAAAEYLARATLDAAQGDAAVAEILTRAGIPIVSSANGALLNQPAVPAFVDVYIYDFEVAIIAGAIQANARWRIDDLAGFASALGLEVNGAEVKPEVIAKAIPRWMQYVPGEPLARNKFLPLVLRQLGLQHDEPGDLAAGADPSGSTLDPLQFALLSASLLSRTGAVSTAALAPSAAGHGAIPLAQTTCQDLKKQLDDPTGLKKKVAKDAVIDWVEQEIGEKAGADVKAVIKGIDLLGDGLSVGLLLAGLKLDVKDDARPVRNNAHYAHKVFEERNFFQYIATLSFDSPLPNGLIQCAALAGVKLPENGPVKGWRIQWQLEQDGQHVIPVAGSKPQPGDSGEDTDGNGQSRLKVEVMRELGCPSSSSCGRGQIKTGSATGVASVMGDYTNLPVKISDMFNLPKAAGKLIIDLLKKMSLPTGRDKVVMTWHQPDFELTFDSTMSHSGAGYTADEHIKAKVVLKIEKVSEFPLPGGAMGSVIELTGEGPVEIVGRGPFEGAQCSDGQYVERPGNLRVVSAKLTIMPESASSPLSRRLDQVELVYTLDPEIECTKDGSHGPNGWNLQAGYLRPAQVDDEYDYSGPDILITARKWQIDGLSGKKPYQWVDKPAGGYEFSEKSTLEIKPLLSP